MRPLLLLFLVLWVVVGVLAYRHTRPPPPEEPKVTACESLPAASLVWLARHQAPDGRWSGTRYMEQCAGTACSGISIEDGDEELTGLALLGFLGAGYTPQNRSRFADPHSGKEVRFGETVRKGIGFLLGRQNAEGAIRSRFSLDMKGHAVAALALCEAYGITNAVAYRGPATRAVAFIASACLAERAWGDDDTNVECAMALKSAQICGIEVADLSSVVVAAWAEKPARTASEAAKKLVSRIFFERRKVPDMRPLALMVAAEAPRWEDRAFHEWQYETMALFQFDGPEGPVWKSWNKPLANLLCDRQAIRKDGCADGSWDGPCGRVRATAEATLTLEIYYRYASVFGSK